MGAPDDVADGATPDSPCTGRERRAEAVEHECVAKGGVGLDDGVAPALAHPVGLPKAVLAPQDDISIGRHLEGVQLDLRTEELLAVLGHPLEGRSAAVVTSGSGSSFELDP